MNDRIKIAAESLGMLVHMDGTESYCLPKQVREQALELYIKLSEIHENAKSQRLKTD